MANCPVWNTNKQSCLVHQLSNRFTVVIQYVQICRKHILSLLVSERRSCHFHAERLTFAPSCEPTGVLVLNDVWTGALLTPLSSILHTTSKTLVNHTHSEHLHCMVASESRLNRTAVRDGYQCWNSKSCARKNTHIVALSCSSSSKAEIT